MYHSGLQSLEARPLACVSIRSAGVSASWLLRNQGCGPGLNHFPAPSTCSAALPPISELARVTVTFQDSV